MSTVTSLKQLLQNQAATTAHAGLPHAPTDVMPQHITLWGTLSIGWLLAACVNPTVTLALHVALLAMSVSGVRQALMALTIICLIKFLNPVLVHYSAECGLLFWLVLLTSCLRILLPQLKQVVSVWIWLLLFGGFSLLSSLFTSRLPLISASKSIAFLMVALACCIGASQLSAAERSRFANWLVSLIALIVIVSIPTYWIPAIGFWKNGRGFQGVLNHPQVLGVFLAPILAFLLAGLMKAELRKLYFVLPCIVVIGTLLVLSQARTGMLATGLALLVVLLLYLNPKIGLRVKLAAARSVAGVAMAVLLFAVALMVNPDFQNSVESYIYKNRGTEIGESFERSRGAGAEHHFNNFLESPLVGHGFGVFAKPDPREEIQTAFGIPISSSTEKGIVLIAILEETGIIGFSLFAIFLASMIRQTLRGIDLRYIAAFFACLFVNFGEAVFFAPGGIGLYFWVLISLCMGMGMNATSASTNTRSSNEEHRILANIIQPSHGRPLQ